MVLEEISQREFEREKDVFKLQRWNGKGKPLEWYFRMIKSVETLKVKNTGDRT